MQTEFLKKTHKFKHRGLGCDFLALLEETAIHIYHSCASVRMYCSLKIRGPINVLFFTAVASRDSNFSLAYVSDTHYHLSSEINGIDCICLDELTVQQVKDPQISFILI